MALSDGQKKSIKDIVDRSIKTEGQILKIINFLIGGGPDDTHGMMGWKILEEIAKTSPEAEAYISSLPDQQPATHSEIGEYVYQILNEKIF